jgi:hypothetical protein
MRAEYGIARSCTSPSQCIDPELPRVVASDLAMSAADGTELLTLLGPRLEEAPMEATD